jgi:hypothetical protein
MQSHLMGTGCATSILPRCGGGGWQAGGGEAAVIIPLSTTYR